MSQNCFTYILSILYIEKFNHILMLKKKNKKKKPEDALSLPLLKVTLQLIIQTCSMILLWDQTSSSTGQ